jgi:hypothetical protein
MFAYMQTIAVSPFLLQLLIEITLSSYIVLELQKITASFVRHFNSNNTQATPTGN